MTLDDAAGACSMGFHVLFEEVEVPYETAFAPSDGVHGIVDTTGREMMQKGSALMVQRPSSTACWRALP